MSDVIDTAPSGSAGVRPGGSAAESDETRPETSILLVEGQPSDSDLVRRAFERRERPLRLRSVSSLDDARGALETADYDLLLLDWKHLEDEAIWPLPKTGDEPSRPTIVMSDRGGERIAVEAMRKGALDYVDTRGKSLDELPRLVDRALREWGHIVERRRAEQALAESERHFRQLVEHSQDVVTILRPDGRINYESPSIEGILGYRPEELVGKSVFEFVHADDHARLLEGLREARENPGETQRIEYRFRHKDGSWRIIESVGGARPGDHGRNREVVTSRDITERKEAERERAALEAQLHHAQKLETIGTLAGGIAHDFNNILTSLFGFAGLVGEALPKDSAVRGDLDQVLHAAQRAKDLVRRILMFSRQVEPERRPVNIGAVVRDALSLSRASLPSSISIQTHINPRAGVVDADPSQLNQVLLNLCTNAAHAMRQNGGVLRIDVQQVDLDERGAARYPGLARGCYARIDVSDTGHGIDPGTLRRIFEPFFTTKAKTEGTGLGLAVVHGIISSHGGLITAESSVGEGTRFVILLPSSTSDEVEPDSAVPAMLRGDERILFVDDEPDIVAPVHRLLTLAGYQVEVTTSAWQALSRVEREPEGFDLIITDRTMPAMSGVDLAGALLAIRPDLPIILVSGYGTSADDLTDGRFRAALGKPFTFEELASAIRRTLDR